MDNAIKFLLGISIFCVNSFVFAQSIEGSSLNGHWIVEKLVEGENNIPIKNGGVQVFISGSRYVVLSQGTGIAVTAKILPQTDATGTITLVPQAGGNIGKQYSGYYEVKEDRLSIIYLYASEKLVPRDALDDEKIARQLFMRRSTTTSSLVNTPYYENSLGMKFNLVLPSTFAMGAKIGEPSRLDETARRVTISQPYFLGIHEVTVGEFKKYLESAGDRTLAENEELPGGFSTVLDGSNRWITNANLRNPGFPQDESHPAVFISWIDAKAFCEWLSKKEGMKYRLPTEAEWELAARAEGASSYSWGMDPSGIYGNANFSDKSYSKAYPNRSSNFDYDDGYVHTAPVGSFQPNRLGFYDMHGNVFEWTEDYWSVPTSKVLVDPKGPAEGDQKIAKGGAFGSRVDEMRVGFRFRDDPRARFAGVGFRIVLDPNQ